MPDPSSQRPGPARPKRDWVRIAGIAAIALAGAARSRGAHSSHLHLPASERNEPASGYIARSRDGRDTEQPKRRDWVGIWVGIATIVAIGLAGLPGLAAFLALHSTNQQVNHTNQQVNHQLQIAEQGQITDRYNAAITNLGSRSIEVRLGGIYALQRLMQDSLRDQPTIIAVLCAFVRDQTAPAVKPRNPPASHLPTDIQAALTVVGARNTANDGLTTVVDFNHAHLAKAQLDGLQLSGAYFYSADLSHANFTATNLTQASFTGANLTGANFTAATLAAVKLFYAKLTGADLVHANLTGAYLTSADLAGADLAGANLTDVSLADANLTGASLLSANLAYTDLIKANLTGAELTGADLTDADLRGAEWPKNFPPPKGWVRDPGSGRLRHGNAGA